MRVEACQSTPINDLLKAVDQGSLAVESRKIMGLLGRNWVGKSIRINRLVLVGIFMLASSSAFSQAEQGLTCNVKAGAALSTLAKVTGVKSIASFYAGIALGIPVGKLSSGLLSLQPGGALMNKGYGEVDETGADVKRTIAYVEVPVNVVAYFDVGSGKFFVGAGPYLSVALSSQVITTVEDKVTAVDDIKGVKQLDWGANALLGYLIFNGFSINVGYSVGIVDVVYHKPDSQNRCISVGLGFSF